MKIFLCSLFLLFGGLEAYSQDTLLYHDLKYIYSVHQLSPQKYWVEISQINISNQKILVMNAYNNYDFDTLRWHLYADSLNESYPWKNDKEAFPYCRNAFERDTLIDYFSELQEMEKAGQFFSLNVEPCRTKMLTPASMNNVKFSIRTNENQFYFYERYWTANSNDKDDDIRNLSERKSFVVCFPILLK